ncbi:hypothetical protein ABT186_02225 [Streptomyces sp. NPDC001634]|uniref:hypothetical protein n=1 Tax=Streptomyces sp. NPDC001634 TaxID=3154390 RepID=UPI00332FA6E7
MTGWRLYWLLWLIVGFCVPETYTLITNARNTLSWTVWDWFGVKEGVPLSHWTFLHILLLLFMFWLFFHFVFGIWR